MLFKRIHRTALRGSQDALTGFTGMLTLQSAQNGLQSLSGALQAPLAAAAEILEHQIATYARCIADE